MFNFQQPTSNSGGPEAVQCRMQCVPLTWGDWDDLYSNTFSLAPQKTEAKCHFNEATTSNPSVSAILTNEKVVGSSPRSTAFNLSIGCHLLRVADGDEHFNDWNVKLRQFRTTTTRQGLGKPCPMDASPSHGSGTGSSFA